MAALGEEGVLNIGTNDIYTSPSKTYITISKLTFNCAVAYDILVEIYRSSTGLTNTIYDFALNAGDTVFDASVYALNDGDKLIATTNVANVNYSIIGVTQVSPPVPFIYNQ
jgi:hypothetical protein